MSHKRKPLARRAVVVAALISGVGLLAVLGVVQLSRSATASEVPLSSLPAKPPPATPPAALIEAIDAGPPASLSAESRKATAMTGFRNGAVITGELPRALQRVPADLAPAPGSARILAENIGQTGISIYAWEKGSGGRVCKSNSRGSGGCFTQFQDWAFFNATLSDPDRIGAGEPLYVWGVVPDEVVRVTVLFRDEEHEAAIENNAVVFELPDATILPFEVDGYVVELADGSRQFVRS